ncbi:hypothetical protein LEP1GSC117_0260 [Leptospira interrogans serovar Icterohaemorrhagiae str. Verdun LP]|nr:hypothetical protein LEP1GSC117_0260 [Leptospira interrogans serovar Icterohaemorrhagiae str. Verdun LP]EMO35000.1 hypothetical protein LEP1GSC177_1229 [Leptospira interrogans str. MMD3731]
METLTNFDFTKIFVILLNSRYFKSTCVFMICNLNEDITFPLCSCSFYIYTI